MVVQPRGEADIGRGAGSTAGEYHRALMLREVAVALAAARLPARRRSRVDPNTALRHE
jgi:hypothetical protein